MNDPREHLQSEFNGLDIELDPPRRCSTSFFKLLTSVAVDSTLLQSGDLSEADKNRGGTLRLWANRPGQNGSETVTLALLSFWLTSGITVDLITDRFEECWWSWAIALLLAPVVSFAALHFFTLVVALSETVLRGLGIAQKKSSNSVTLFLSLTGLTATAVLAAISGQWILIAAAAPWLIWATLNFFAWVMLLLRSLFRSLGHLN